MQMLSLLEAITWPGWAILFCVAIATVIATSHIGQRLRSAVPKSKPISVNCFFTRQCNYECGFCFHTAKTNFVLPLGEAERGLELLKESGKYDAVPTAWLHN